MEKASACFKVSGVNSLKDQSGKLYRSEVGEFSVSFVNEHKRRKEIEDHCPYYNTFPYNS